MHIKFRQRRAIQKNEYNRKEGPGGTCAMHPLSEGPGGTCAMHPLSEGPGGTCAMHPLSEASVLPAVLTTSQ